jgi:ribosomal protein S19E (S16A)
VQGIVAGDVRVGAGSERDDWRDRVEGAVGVEGKQRRGDRMNEMTAQEVESILNQLEAAGIIKRGKTSIRLTTYGREKVKRAKAVSG